MNLTDKQVQSGFKHYELPEVLIVLGNYRQSEFILDAIRSIAQQTYSKFRCVVVDDYSQDGSSDTISSILAELSDDRFTFIALTENGGQMNTMLSGLDACETGEFVAFIDADDIWHERFLETHLAFHLSSARAAGITASEMLKVDANKRVTAGTTHQFQKLSGPFPVQNEISFISGHPISEFDSAFLRNISGVYVSSMDESWIWSATSGIVFRRDILTLIKPDHPSTIPICADAYLAYLSHFVSGTIQINYPLASYRVHGNNNFFGNESKSPEKREFLRSVDVQIWEAKLLWLNQNKNLAKRVRRGREIRECRAYMLRRTGKKKLPAEIKASLKKLRRKIRSRLFLLWSR